MIVSVVFIAAPVEDTLLVDVSGGLFPVALGELVERHGAVDEVADDRDERGDHEDVVPVDAAGVVVGGVVEDGLGGLADLRRKRLVVEERFEVAFGHDAVVAVVAVGVTLVVDHVPGVAEVLQGGESGVDLGFAEGDHPQATGQIVGFGAEQVGEGSQSDVDVAGLSGGEARCTAEQSGEGGAVVVDLVGHPGHRVVEVEGSLEVQKQLI